jgi:hypothetical protein
MQRPITSESDCKEIKYNKARDDKIRFSEIRQDNKVRRGEIRKKQASEI